MKTKGKRSLTKTILMTILSLFIIFVVGCSNVEVVKITSDKKVINNDSSSENLMNDTDMNVSGNLVVNYIDVGQADSILIQQNNKSMLIDGGNNADSQLVVNFLKDKGVKKLDYVIGTHPHEDHIGGLDIVINNFEIGQVLIPNKVVTTKTYKDFIKAIKNKKIKITSPIPGDKYLLGDAEWEILAPSKDKKYKDTNNYSIVIRMVFGSNSFVFTGDAEDVLEKEILQNGFEIKSDVLKVGHHGSHSSTTDNFLDKVNPKYAVISCGKDNDYGHPHEETINKLRDRNIKVYRTDLNGTITCVSDGENIIFETSK